jgi:hypothetical protein
MSVTRRSFFARAGAVATAQGLALQAQQRSPVDPGATPQDLRMATGDVAKLFHYSDRRAARDVWTAAGSIRGGRAS